MSVPRAARNESEMEFLHNARALLEFTLRRCKKIPKRFTFTLNTRIVETAWGIHDAVMEGNSTYPTNAHEVQVRRDHFLRAKALLHTLIGQIEMAGKFAPIDGETMREWVSLISKEIGLIKGVLDADKRRYKYLLQ